MEYTIYKIICKDENIKDCYVGSTKDFNKRKAQHKIDLQHRKMKLQTIINNNGGWDNWNMIEIEKIICENYNEARQKERYYYEKLNATLNSQQPVRYNYENLNQQKNYYIKNKELIIEKNKQYYVNNKEIILQKCLCICGNYYTKKHKARHELSKKHQDYLCSNC
jgi:predicted GIY-YIG superfamily endonuclease